ncbi:helix-turn-helix transcriptional regulator [Kitasatospora sp. NPDC050463]|uniref:helix-turn-helix domain-containing protein n=1 Tax=Kitasatospora sp. NPDC050463 TaxID=3155786 RepID=UPI0033CAFBA4
MQRALWPASLRASGNLGCLPMAVRKRSALAARRAAAGYTQESFAAAMCLDRTTVGRWELGKSEPQTWQRPKLTEVLGVTPGQLDEILRQTQEQAERSAGSATDDPVGKLAPRPSAPTEATGVRLDIGAPQISDWAAVYATPPADLQERRLWVTDEEVGVAAGMLAMFRQLDHTHGARSFAPQVRSYIAGELDSLLARPAADERVARHRARVTVGFLELAGYQAVDTGSPAQAQAYYQRALALTTATNDQAYGAYLVAVNLGHLALHCDEPQTALRWASSAHAAAGTATSPATRSAITAVVARANARLGRESEATKLILQAEELLGTANPQEEPDWIRYFTPAYLADEVAHCWHDLGRAPAARTQLAEALDGVGRDKVRRLAIDAALLASTWLRTGDLDQACATGLDAVAYAARTGSGRCVERVAGVLAELDAHAGYAPVQDLREYTRAVLPEAHRLALTMARGA